MHSNVPVDELVAGPPGDDDFSDESSLNLDHTQLRVRVRRLRRGVPPIFGALVALVALSGLIAPASLKPVSIAAVLPFAAFLAIAALGEALVVMHGGIDLSVPAVVTMVGIVLLDVSGGTDAELLKAIVVTLGLATLIGLVNGILVAKARVPALVATLAMSGLVTGLTLWYRGNLQAESSVPPRLAELGGHKLFGISYLGYPAVLAVLLTTLLVLLARFTTIGRRFVLVGANPRAAWVAGLRVSRFQIGAYAAAGFLYGVMGLALAGFIRNPGQGLGGPYLLSPIVAVVIGGIALSGGAGSFAGVLGGALFLTQLDQVLKVRGLGSGLQSVLVGVVILAAVADRSVVLAPIKQLVRRRS